MRVKIFSQPGSGDPRAMETQVNDFLATLTTASIKHVDTAIAAAEEDGLMKTETIITIWYDDLSDLKAASAVSEAEIIDFPQDGLRSEQTI
jgi:hypothetical protein